MCRLCSGNTDREMVPVSQLWEPVQQTTGPGQRRSVFWPSRTSAPTTTVSLLPPHRGDAGSNLLTLRTRCRRIGLVLGQQAVFQPVICSRNTARCPALSARGGALVTAPGTQGGCGRLGSGCGSVWLPAVTAGLLGQQVACWSAQDGGGAGVTGLALSLSWGCRSKSAQSGRLEISAVCSLPAQRPEVHSQEWAEPWLFSGPGGGRFLLLRACPAWRPCHPGLCLRPHLTLGPSPECLRPHFSLLGRTPVAG